MSTAPLTCHAPAPSLHFRYGHRRALCWLRGMETRLATWLLEAIAAIGLWTLAQPLFWR